VHVAELDAPHPPAAEEAAQRELRQELLRRGLFETSAAYYAKLGAWLLCLLAAALALTLGGWAKCGAMLLGLFWQQCAFVGHDAGHNALTHDRATDKAIGLLVGPILTGISIEWWCRSHNVHHVATNSIERDPDIQHLPAMAIDSAICERYWSTYHDKVSGCCAYCCGCCCSCCC